jgi:hypothetical protein
MRSFRLSIFAGLILALLAHASAARASGSITGYGRFEKIAGVPSAGHQQLYEWDLFLSPADNSMVGPFRRLGAPPGEPARGDGYYRFDGLPEGVYSVYVNQPDFFASPKVVPNVEIKDGQTTSLNVDLDVDYSTYFSQGGQWSDWKSTWYQTFLATGTSVRGVSWKMAGWGQYGGKTGRITILEDNGNPDVRNWKPLGTKNDDHIASDSDEWVRWPSGQIPITPGKMCAVKVQVDGGCAVYKRNKDGMSYPHGRAYDENGNPQNFDLNITVFVDKNSQMVTHTRLGPGPGDFDGGLNDTTWGQTFIATGTSLAAVDLFAASGVADTQLTWRIRQAGPAGPQIGPTKTTLGAYFASSTDLIGVSYNPGQVSLIPGQTYYIGASSPVGFTPYVQPSWNAYSDGRAYRRGAATSRDLAMTIMEHTVAPEPKPTDLNDDKFVNFYDFCVFSADWRRRGDSPPTDLNWDKVVDASDFAELAGDWLVWSGVPPRR